MRCHTLCTRCTCHSGYFVHLQRRKISGQLSQNVWNTIRRLFPRWFSTPDSKYNVCALTFAFHHILPYIAFTICNGQAIAQHRQQTAHNSIRKWFAHFSFTVSQCSKWVIRIGVARICVQVSGFSGCPSLYSQEIFEFPSYLVCGCVWVCVCVCVNMS